MDTYAYVGNGGAYQPVNCTPAGSGGSSPSGGAGESGGGAGEGGGGFEGGGGGGGGEGPGPVLELQ